RCGDCLLGFLHQKFDPPTVATIPHSVFLKSLTDVVRSIPRSSRMRRLIATFLTLAAVLLAATPADTQQEREGRGRGNIIILDACRNNPFADRLTQSGRAAPSRGLGRIDATGEGSLIVYSTQPNNVALDGAGRNSPFTAALLKHVITPGIEVRQMIS